MPARQKYKILKKIRESKRDARKEARKHPKKSIKKKLIQIPNICPFKEEILKDVEAAKQRAAEEKIRQKTEQRNLQKKENLESMVMDAVKRDAEFDEAMNDQNLIKKVYILYIYYKGVYLTAAVFRLMIHYSCVFNLTKIRYLILIKIN